MQVHARAGDLREEHVRRRQAQLRSRFASRATRPSPEIKAAVEFMFKVQGWNP